MGKPTSGRTIPFTKMMQLTVEKFLVSAGMTRDGFCEATCKQADGKRNPYGLARNTLNHLLAGEPPNISRTMAIRLADTMGMPVEEFVPDFKSVSGLIAEDNGWRVSGKFEGRPRETPNGVSFFVKKVSQMETGTDGRGKFYCVSQFKLPDRALMQLRLNRHEMIGSLTARIEHPNLSSRIAAFSNADDYLVIDRWVEGQELSLQVFGKSPSAAFVRKTMKGIASGLAALHKKGIILRWLEPRGVLVTDDGDATLVDYEFAKLPGELLTVRPDDQLPDTGYLAPQVRRGLDVSDDFSADLYSWACILATLVSGRRPGEAKDHPAELVAGSRLPVRIRSIAARCLELDPSDRPANGDELLKAIRRW